jgi:hypothetical protein
VVGDGQGRYGEVGVVGEVGRMVAAAGRRAAGGLAAAGGGHHKKRPLQRVIDILTNKYVAA